MADKNLKIELERLYRTYDRTFLDSDPLGLVHGFRAGRDLEVAGLIASSLAYGRVEGIRRSIERVFELMGGEPYRFTMAFRPQGKGKKIFSDSRFVHRFTRAEDVACLIYFARQMIEEGG
ncbi:MAG: DUF2400 family protein, partial [Thermodesulfobacteriota bacterium]